MLMMENAEMNFLQLEATAKVLNGKEFNRIKKQEEQAEPKLVATGRDGFREGVRAPITQGLPGHGKSLGFVLRAVGETAGFKPGWKCKGC